MRISVPKEKLHRLNSLNLAAESFRSSLEGLINMKALTPDFGPYEVMMAGVCTLYWRPFGGSRALRLTEFANFPKDAVGKRMSTLHAHVDVVRNQLMAHQEIEGWDKKLKNVEGAVPVREVVVTVRPRLTFQQSSVFPPGELHRLMPELLVFQLTRVDNARFQLWGEIAPPSFSYDSLTLVAE